MSTTPNNAAGKARADQRAFSSEIVQMCFVFNGETRRDDDDVVQYIEEIVRLQLGELIVQGRVQAARRGARTVIVEDILFLIRHDRPKLDRIRNYLSWKDVRKKMDADQEDVETMDEPDRTRLKNHIKLPWELSAIFSKADRGGDDGDDFEEEEVEAYEESKKLLKEADDITRDMTKEQYEHYAACRAASFIHRKGKKFRDFLNLGPMGEGTLSDDVLEVLGFLGYEMVRALCTAGAATKRRMALSRANAAMTLLKSEQRQRGRKDKKRGSTDKDGATTPAAKDDDSPRAAGEGAASTEGGPSKRLRKSTLDSSAASPRSPPRVFLPPTSLFSEPIDTNPATVGVSTPKGTEAIVEGIVGQVGAQDKQQLQLQDVMSGHIALQKGSASLKASGMRNWRGGLTRMATRF